MLFCIFPLWQKTPQANSIISIFIVNHFIFVRQNYDFKTQRSIGDVRENLQGWFLFLRERFLGVNGASFCQWIFVWGDFRKRFYTLWGSSFRPTFCGRFLRGVWDFLWLFLSLRNVQPRPIFSSKLGRFFQNLKPTDQGTRCRPFGSPGSIFWIPVKESGRGLRSEVCIDPNS